MKLITTMNELSKITLSVEKIPVVLRPVFKRPQSGVGTQENCRNLGILSILVKF